MFLFRLTLFFLTFSYLSASGAWIYEPAFPTGSSARGTALIYKQTNSKEKFEARYLKTVSGTQLILSLFWAPIPFQRDVSLSVQFGNGVKQSIQGTLLKGGHKIILPAQTSFRIAQALSRNQTVTFSIQSFDTVITPDGFSQGWTRFRTFL